MKSRILYFLLFLLLIPFTRSQTIKVGYNATYYYRDFKQLSVEKNRFNSNAGELTKPFNYVPVMHGLELGFGEMYGNFSFDMTYRMRKLKAKGLRSLSNGNTDFKQLKLTHNVFVMGIYFGDKEGRYRIGYEVELGVFKRRDRDEERGKWEKNRRGPITGALNLVALIRLDGDEEKGGVFLKPYWRMSGHVYKQYYTQFAVNEYYNLQAFGLSAVIAIKVDK